MLLVSDGDVKKEDAQDFAATGQVSDEVADKSREESAGHFSGRNFLDFTGDFTTEVRGEDCRINVNAFSSVSAETVSQDTAVGQQLAGIMSGEENDQWLRDRNLDKWDLINNLRDWVDVDNTVASGKGGYEDDYYNKLASPYLAKNAKFDTVQEIRMVEGWQDDVYERFGGQITVYGGGKVDLNCADDDTLKGLFRAYIYATLTDAQIDKLLSDYHTAMESTAGLTSGSALTNWLKNEGYSVNPALSGVITTATSTFTLTSVGQVGDAATRITAVVDYSSSDEGKVVYWRTD
jgi:general secretion pathway protein K